jgi:hypothetical protein
MFRAARIWMRDAYYFDFGKLVLAQHAANIAAG